MKKHQLDALKLWFDNYVDQFQISASDIGKNLALKKNHTKRVCDEILFISKGLALKEDEINLAEAMALLHDVGRFEQYKKYRTFLDLKSENHAELGIRILEENKVLNKIDREEKSLIVKAISFHNRKSLPENEAETCLFFSRLLRDADKLDIWRVVIEYYFVGDHEKNGAIVFGLPETSDFSLDAYENLISKKLVEVDQIRCANDLRLLQLSWIYDVNFVPALRRIKLRQFLETLISFLPPSEKIETAKKLLQNYLLEKINSKKISTSRI